MSLLRQKVIACIPDEDAVVHKFLESRQVTEKVPVFDKQGNKVREIESSRIERVPIPDEVWENRGISAELFSLENQIAAGVQVTRFDGSFIGIDLDESDKLGDEFISRVNSFVSEQINNESKNDTETIKFD